jgi:hypothetical protein
MTLPPRGIPPYHGMERFVRLSDPESYADRTTSSWYDHPCKTGQRVVATRSVVPGHPGWGLGVGLRTLPQKFYCYETSRAYGGGQDPHRVVVPVKKEKITLHLLIQSVLSFPALNRVQLYSLPLWKLKLCYCIPNHLL